LQAEACRWQSPIQGKQSNLRERREPHNVESLGDDAMFATPDFSAFEPRGPQRLPKPTIDYVPNEFAENAPAMSQIYAAAWSQAHRDHELDKLFNCEFYDGQGI
jgi:hypothetical protein